MWKHNRQSTREFISFVQSLHSKQHAVLLAMHSIGSKHWHLCFLCQRLLHENVFLKNILCRGARQEKFKKLEKSNLLAPSAGFCQLFQGTHTVKHHHCAVWPHLFLKETFLHVPNTNSIQTSNICHHYFSKYRLKHSGCPPLKGNYTES